MGLLDYIKKWTSSSALNSKEMRLIVLGLDNAGKTSILRALSNEEITSVKPTQGFIIKSLQHQSFKLNVWDVGGNVNSKNLLR
jgi:ADP-ribosylation factor-like protein 3